MGSWKKHGPYSATKNPAKKHNRRTSTIFSCHVSSFDSSYGWWYIDDRDVYGETYDVLYTDSFDDVTLSTTLTEDIPNRPSNNYDLYVNVANNQYVNVTVNSVSITHTYGDLIAPRPSCGQNGGYMRPDVENSFNVSVLSYGYMDEEFKLKKAKWFYKESTSQNYSYIEKSYPVTSSGGAFEIPANTLVTGKTYNQYLELTADDDQVATLSLNDISTVDGIPEVATKSPSNEIVYGETNFSWEYSNPRGTLQHAYDIQISYDNGSTWTTIFNHVVSSSTISQKYTGILSGTCLWRVRAYNMDDVSSSWSSPAGFICNVPPTAPDIYEVVPGGRVTVKWSAIGQKAYRLRIINQNGGMVYDSGDVYSIASEAFVNEYLPNGEYVAQVKIFNSFGIESEYGQFTFSQDQQLADPEVTGASAGGAVISISNYDQYEVCYLKRNGELIATFTSGTYLDRFASGPTEYTVIAVDENDQFGMKTIMVDVQHDSPMLIRKNGATIELENRWSDRVEVAQAENTRYEEQEYLGAYVPVHVFARMRTKRITVAFADRDRIAKNLLGEVVYYADGFGNGDWVAVISSSRTDQWFGDETTLQLEMTDGGEGIQYEI